MHFMVVSFQLVHNNEEGYNDTIIPDMEGRDKDTNDNSTKFDYGSFLKSLAAFFWCCVF
jgi:hypothetical protein